MNLKTRIKLAVLQSTLEKTRAELFGVAQGLMETGYPEAATRATDIQIRLTGLLIHVSATAATDPCESTGLLKLE